MLVIDLLDVSLQFLAEHLGGLGERVHLLDVFSQVLLIFCILRYFNEISML